MPIPVKASLLVAALFALPALAPAAEPAYASTYAPVASGPVLVRNATVLTGTGQRLDGADVLMRDGRIVAVGSGLDAGNAAVVDGSGKWVTPGIIDVHSHLGVYPSPGANAHNDGNEMTAPVTAQVWAEHGVWPQDPGFGAALAGGVTSMMILPGSANLIGGRGVVLKNVAATTMQEMKFPDAPHGLKMACGENPKRVYGGRGQAPMTRMGNIAGYRAAFAEAQKYRAAWDKYEAGKDSRKGAGDAPARDLRLDTLAGVLRGDITVQIHCYRADEMALMLDLAKEFDFRIAAFHHGVEAYKLADRLAEEGVCGALWADWWGFKMEAYDGIQENIALVDRPKNSCAIVHSDSAEGIQRLNQGSGQGDGARRARRPVAATGTRDPLAHHQRRACDRHRRTDRFTRGRQDGRRGAVERQSLQRLRQGRKSLGGRCASLRPRRSVEAAGQRLHARPGGVAVKRLLLAFALAAALPAAAQDVLIKDATVHTAGARGTLKDHDVLVQGGVVRAIAPDLAAPAGATVIEAKGRPLTPGLFAGLTHLGIEEVSAEPTTADANLALGAMVPAQDHVVWRPEFDVDVAFNPHSSVIGVTRVEGFTHTVLSPGSLPGGSFVAGQGSAVRLDGSYDAVLPGSRSLFVNLGGAQSPLSGGSRAGQWMLLEQAVSEARAGSGELLTRAGRSALSAYLAGGRVVFQADRAADIRQALAFAKNTA